MAALAAGQVEIAFSEVDPILPQIRVGRARALAVTGTRRDAALPDTPTVAEAGFEGMTFEDYIGIVAPKGTPAAAIKRLETALITAGNSPEVRNRLAQMNRAPAGETSTQLASRVNRDIARWTALVKQQGLKLQ